MTAAAANAAADSRIFYLCLMVHELLANKSYAWAVPATSPVRDSYLAELEQFARVCVPTPTALLLWWCSCQPYHSILS